MERRRINQGVSTDIQTSHESCKSLVGFIKEAWPIVKPVAMQAGSEIETEYVHGWHIDFWCAHLEAITQGTFLDMGLQNRLMGNVPPGTMKSLMTSVFWQAWEWGPMRMPHLQHLATSYREKNCLRDSRRFRTLVTSEWYQQRWPHVRLKMLSESEVENTAGGWRKTMPFGSLTGERADRLTIDDPHSIDTAESDADRNRAEMTFRESATTRMNNPIRSAIVLIMQRLHENDLSGIVIKDKMPYIKVMLPMRFEVARKCVTPLREDPRTEEGELLFRERFPEEVLARDEAAMGSHAVAGQMQQRPYPRGGLMFQRHWFRKVPAAPSDCRWVRAWDLAGSVKKKSAWTAGVLVGYQQREKHFYIADVVRVRVLNPEQTIKMVAETDGRGVEISLPQDPGAAGLVQARAHVAALLGFNVHCSPESGEKADRAIPVQSQAEVGNISIVEGPWNGVFFDELVAFPASEYKDQVDAMSRAFARFILVPGVVTVAPVIMTAPIVIHGSHQGYD